jgi:hypothetical protein
MEESLEPQHAVPAAIQDALARTDDLESVPVAEHVARFETVHGALANALSAIEE